MGTRKKDPKVKILLIKDTYRNSFIIGSSHRAGTMEQIQVMGVQGLPLIHAGDDIAVMICERLPLQEGDILCIASTIYSKSKGYTKPLATITPSERAERLANLNGEDPGSSRQYLMHRQILSWNTRSSSLNLPSAILGSEPVSTRAISRMGW